MSELNLKLFQQMVDKGIIAKYQKKEHSGKIDNDAENTNLQNSIEENFDANNDGAVNEQDIDVMKETYNQMIDYLASVNKNAANIKIVDLTDATSGITSRTKMFFDEAGDLKWYQDGYSYYGDNKEKGYTQHLLSDGTKKVVDNFEYNEQGQAVKWDENIFADEATTEFIKSKQEITWADDKLNAATRLVQNIDKTTGEVTEIKAYKLNEDNVDPSKKTSTEKIFNVALLKNSFFGSWSADTSLESKSSNFSYKINFGDLTAKLSAFKSNSTVYNILNDESRVYATDDNGKNINIYDKNGNLQNKVINNINGEYPGVNGNKVFLSASETIILANGENVVIDDDNTVKITTSDGKFSSISKIKDDVIVTLNYDDVFNSLNTLTQKNVNDLTNKTTITYLEAYKDDLINEIALAEQNGEDTSMLQMQLDMINLNIKEYNDSTTSSSNISFTDRLLKDVVAVKLAQKVASDINSNVNSDEYKNTYNSVIKSELIKTPDNMKNRVGEIVEKADGLYVNDGSGLVKLGISPETYLELFPPIERYDINQQDIVNCYFISGCLIDMMKNPLTFSKLIQMFSENANGDISLKFDGFLKDSSPVTFKNGDLKVVDGFVNNQAVKKYNQTNGSKGIQMLEQAVAIAMFARDYEKEIDTIDIDECIYFNVKRENYSGWQNEIYKAVLGNISDAQFIKVTGNAIDYIDVEKLNNGTILYSFDWITQDLSAAVPGHAYSIEKIDMENQLVYVSDPFYAGVQNALSFEEFNRECTYINIGYFKA